MEWGRGDDGGRFCWVWWGESVVLLNGGWGCKDFSMEKSCSRWACEGGGLRRQWPVALELGARWDGGGVCFLAEKWVVGGAGRVWFGPFGIL